MKALSTRALALGCVVALALVSGRGAEAAPADAFYANDTEGIFWFMHISDIHVGADGCLEPGEMHDPENFIFAMNDAVEVIRPVFVVATGDLVNGCRNRVPTGGQDQDEWNGYKTLYTAALAAHPYPYYDVVGNHDEYAPRWPSDECPSLHWYLDNSYRGPLEGAAHFSWKHTTSRGDYFFYALNATGECVDAFTSGNGEILQSEYDALKAALEANADARLAFVFAHQGPHAGYIPKNADPLWDLVAQHGAFYLHGHVHEYKEYLLTRTTGYTVVNEVNTLGKGTQNNIGVGVIDHDAFIYRAASTAEPWPFVIVTAPVATRLRNQQLNPWAYRVCKDRSNPVRALVFSPTVPTSVTVQVGSSEALPMTQVDTAIWKADVDTSFLAEGEAAVTVTVQAGGKTHSDSVIATFVAGPCQVQDDAGVPPPDGGGSDGNAADGAGAEAAAGGDGGGDGPSGDGSDGCGCRVGGTDGGAGARGTWIGLAGLGLALGAGARRRGGRRNASFRLAKRPLVL